MRQSTFFTLNERTISFGQTPLVMVVVAAEGTMELAMMLYLAPSIANVRVRPSMPALAAPYYQR